MTMKTKISLLLAGFGLATVANAGTPSTITAAAPGAGLWEWFAGASIGYLSQLDQPMYGLQVGAEFKSAGAQASHAVYLEIGFTQDDANYAYTPPAGITGGRTASATMDLNIIPITLNYKYEAAITEHLSYYVGLGLGIAILDSTYDWSWSQALAPPNNQGAGSDDRTDVRFYGDVFAGLSYALNDSLRVYAGARYIFMDNVDRHIDVTNAATYSAGINNDVLFEIGVRYRF